MEGATGNGDWRSGAPSNLAALATAVAGSVIFVYLLGGAVMYVRIRQTDLPTSRTLAVVPRELLLVVGLTRLLFPMAVIGGAVLLAVFIVEHLPPPERRSIKDEPLCKQVVFGALVIVVVLILLVVLAALFHYDDAGVIEACLVAGFVWYLLRIFRGRPERQLPKARLAIASALLAGGIAIAGESAPPPPFERATVTVEDGAGSQRGRFIAAGSEAVYLGRGEDLVVIPNSRVAALHVEPVKAEGGKRSLLDWLHDEGLPGWIEIPGND